MLKFILIGCLIGNLNPFQFVASLFVSTQQQTQNGSATGDTNGTTSTATATATTENAATETTSTGADANPPETNGTADADQAQPEANNLPEDEFTPSIWTWALENKLYASMMLFFISNFIEGQMISTGAFEVFYNDVRVWSKLDSGRPPSLQELLQIIENQNNRFGFDPSGSVQR